MWYIFVWMSSQVGVGVETCEALTGENEGSFHTYCVSARESPSS